VAGGVTKQTLFIANDNDFLGTITDTNHPAGIANPNRFFVFAWDASKLPAYVAQNLEGAGQRARSWARCAHLRTGSRRRITDSCGHWYWFIES
jgi:hypothetical protein